jgi:hypothetical protein
LEELKQGGKKSTGVIVEKEFLPSTCIYRNIIFHATIIFLVLFAGEYHSPVDARGGAGAGMRGLARGDQITLGRSLTTASHDVDQVVNETHVSETIKLTCERRYNQSIETLTALLPHPNATSTTNSTSAVSPTKNNTAFIEKWVSEAEKNETDCLTFGHDHGGSFTVRLSAFSYGLCFAFYFGFVSLVSSVFFV